MSPHYPPLKCKDVKKILTNLGFNFSRQVASHEQWTKYKKGKYYRVTVDCPKQPFGPQLIKYMAQQAGVSKQEFYNALKKKK